MTLPALMGVAVLARGGRGKHLLKGKSKVSVIGLESLEKRQMFAATTGLVPALASTNHPVSLQASAAVVTPVVTQLALFNTDTQKQVAVLDGSNKTIDLAKIGTSHLTIRAGTSGTVQSVAWGINGVANSYIANSSPYSLAGKNSTGGLNAATALKAGTFTITATPYTQVKAAGTAGAAFSVKFTLVNGATTPPTNPPPTDPPPGSPSPTNPPVAGSWKSIFADEFNAMPDPNMWTPSLWGGTVGGGEDQQTYSRSALSVNNGVLNMTASKQALSGQPYTSARISTGGTGQAPTFAFKYGYVEARLKFPPGKGTFPAFWMLPATYNYQYDDARGELDIMEAIGREPTRTYAFDHRYGTRWGKGLDTGFDLSKGFHTYGMDWQPDHLTWYFDGKPFFSVTDPAAIPVVAEYLILNVAIGTSGSWAGPPDASSPFPTTMQVDYVKVWQKA